MDDRELLSMLVTDRVSALARGIRNRQIMEIEERNGGKALPYAEWPSLESCLPEAAAIFKARHQTVIQLLTT